MHKSYAINHIKIVLPDEVIIGSIEIEEGKIKTIQKEPFPHGETIDGILMPGFIDNHIHGGYGYDFMDAKESAINEIAVNLLKEGTTGFLATTLTDSIENIQNALSTIARYDAFFPQKGAQLYGVHLEGPFISEVYKGAQNPKYILKPSISCFLLFEKASNYLIKKVTLAPELEDAMSLISYLKNKHIVASIGHSNASYEIGLEAVEKGANSLTHFYNAMTHLHHRDAGLVGLGLINKTLKTEIILDGIHVSKPALDLLIQSKSSNQVIFVTDSMRAKGLGGGIYDLAGQQVTVKNDARLSDGTLAGSILAMNAACKYAKEVLKLDLSVIAKMASLNPAREIHMADRKGSIEVGKDADLVILDHDFNVIRTIIAGKTVYENNKRSNPL